MFLFLSYDRANGQTDKIQWEIAIHYKVKYLKMLSSICSFQFIPHNAGFQWMLFDSIRYDSYIFNQLSISSV